MSELEQEPETPLFSQLRLYNTVHDSYRYLMIWMWLGQFGTRLAGGKDHASARYIFTQMSPLARYHVLTNSSTLFGFRKSARLLKRIYNIQTVDVVNFVVATGIFCENKWWPQAVRSSRSPFTNWEYLTYICRRRGTVYYCPLKHYLNSKQNNVPFPTLIVDNNFIR